MGLWIEEREVFASQWDRLKSELAATGHQLIAWDERWMDGDRWLAPAHLAQAEHVFFHLSLGHAASLASLGVPGVWCDVDAFACQAWYEDFADELVHQGAWYSTSVGALSVQSSSDMDARIGPGERCFVRPDSPLKPFSGRVLGREGITLTALDHGFYYDDIHLPVIVAPCRDIGVEWRFVVVAGEVISGSSYDAATRTARVGGEGANKARAFASRVAAGHDLSRFGRGCVLDIAEVEGAWRIMEFNPLSGASLYGCDLGAIACALLDDAL